MITFENVSVVAASAEATQGTRSIVHDLSFTLKESKIALIGANGSGKSTIARLINGLILPESGRVTVTVAETALDTAREGRRVRENVAFSFTDPKAQLVMPTALEDVELSLRKQIRNKKERAAKALQVLENFGLADRGSQSVHTLSGGQSQMLALASVLATDPQILVADEPTTLLDLRNSKMVAKLLLSLPQQVIVATHNLELAARCQRALWIEDGKVAFDGDPEEAIARYRLHS